MRAFGGRSLAVIGVLCALGLLAVLWIAGPGQSRRAPAAGGTQSEEDTGTPEAGGSQSAADREPAGADSGGEAPPDGEKSQAEEPEDEPAVSQIVPYDFTQPAPEGAAVDNSYFEDAAFIGDSRTDGCMLYSGIGCGENLSSNGLSIFKLKEKKALTIGGEKYTLLEALALKEYGKVYLSLGVNELGYNNDQGFYRSYCQAIETIRSLQPKAVIYVQGLIPLNESVIAQTGGADYLTNDHLRVYNQLIFQAAREEQVVYLDLYAAFADEEGQLPADASKDGIHLRTDGCRQWLDYLKTHTVDYQTLYPGGMAGGGESLT